MVSTVTGPAAFGELISEANKLQRRLAAETPRQHTHTPSRNAPRALKVKKGPAKRPKVTKGAAETPDAEPPDAETDVAETPDAETGVAVLQRVIFETPRSLRGLALLTTAEVCRALRCSQPTVWRLAQKGRLGKPVRTGNASAMWRAEYVIGIMTGER